jgi:heat shock protein HslJ
MDAAMPNRRPRLQPFLLGGAFAMLALLLPSGDSFAAAATATYRGDAPAASGGGGRRIELRLRTDGSMTWLTDTRAGRAPVTDEGRWYPISTEEFDIIVETRDGKPVNPAVIRFVKKGDALHTTPESADQFGAQGLVLRQVKSAATAAANAPVVGTPSPFGLWRWEGQLATTEKFNVDAPERYTIDIQSGGKALVRADCNKGSASYKMEGRSILFKLGAFTRAACPAGSLSERFLQSLEAVVTQRIKGENLFLDLPGESGSLKFSRTR